MDLIIRKGSVVYSDADAIVNAANPQLQAGGGVCGAIFQAAGCDALARECDAIGGCKTGHAVMTDGYHLKARHIIHTVGPSDKDSRKLKEAFYNTLVIADSNHMKTLAMVPVSVGIYGFPLPLCAKIAVKVIEEFPSESLKTCYMYCYTDAEYDAFVKAFRDYKEQN